MMGEMKIATAAERPDLLGPAWERTRDTLPEYNNHGDVLNVYWGRADRGAARVPVPPPRRRRRDPRPCPLDPASLGRHGRRSARGDRRRDRRGFDEGGANALCALVIMVPRDHPEPRPERDRRRCDARRRASTRPGLADRARPAELEGALPARADRALRRLAPRGRPAVRPMDARARASRRHGSVSPSRGRSASPAPSPSGRSGRACRSPRAATTGSRAVSPQSQIDLDADRGSAAARLLGWGEGHADSGEAHPAFSRSGPGRGLRVGTDLPSERGGTLGGAPPRSADPRRLLAAEEQLELANCAHTEIRPEYLEP